MQRDRQLNRAGPTTHLLLTAAAAASLVLGTSAAANGATQYWDRSNTSGLQSGNGHWRTSGGGPNGTSWNNAAGTGTRVLWTNGNDAVFQSDGTSDAAVNGTVTVGTITFDGTGYTVSGSTLTLVGAGSIITNQNAAISAPIGGSVGLSKSGSATLTLSGANAYTGTTTITAGTIALGASNVFADASDLLIDGGTLDIGAFSDTVNSVTVNEGSILGTTGVLSAAAFFIVEENVTIDAILAGVSAPLTKQDPGTTTLSKANTYGGETAINAGKLRLTGQGKIANSQKINIADGAEFDVTAVTGGPYVIENGQTLAGDGIVRGDLVIAAGATLAPGASPETLTHADGDETWEGGADYQWEINLLAGAQGADPGWDLVDITDGQLIITATSGDQFIIKIIGLDDGSNTEGAIADWDNSVNHLWTIASAVGGIVGFDPDAFALDLSQFTSNNALAGGAFSTAQDGNDLNLVFTAAAVVVPAPTSLAALSAAVAAALLRRRRARWCVR